MACCLESIIQPRSNIRNELQAANDYYIVNVHGDKNSIWFTKCATEEKTRGCNRGLEA